MNNATFLAMRERANVRRQADCDEKSRGYTRGDVDRLINFKRIGEKRGLSPQAILGVYMQKHLDTIDHWINTGEEDAEGLVSRLDDVRNYCDLLEGLYIESQEAQEAGAPTGEGGLRESILSAIKEMRDDAVLWRLMPDEAVASRFANAIATLGRPDPACPDMEEAEETAPR
jgi:hypothetical protein